MQHLVGVHQSFDSDRYWNGGKMIIQLRTGRIATCDIDKSPMNGPVHILVEVSWMVENWSSLNEHSRWSLVTLKRMSRARGLRPLMKNVIDNRCLTNICVKQEVYISLYSQTLLRSRSFSLTEWLSEWLAEWVGKWASEWESEWLS